MTRFGSERKTCSFPVGTALVLCSLYCVLRYRLLYFVSFVEASPIAAGVLFSICCVSKVQLALSLYYCLGPTLSPQAFCFCFRYTSFKVHTTLFCFCLSPALSPQAACFCCRCIVFYGKPRSFLFCFVLFF